MGEACGSAAPCDPARRRAFVVIGALALAYALLIGFVLEPRTFFTGDSGVKYLQARALVVSGWRRLGIANPGGAVDPGARFSVLSVNQFERRAPGAPFYGSYSALFVLPVSVCLAAVGIRGVYIVPLLATLLTLALTYRLSSRTAPRNSWLAPLLVGAASPLAFYSLDLWEHSLATFLVTAGVLWLLAGHGHGVVRNWAIGGILLGLAIDIREELYSLIPPLALLLLPVEPRRRLRASAAALAGALLAVVPHWVLRESLTGSPVRGVAVRTFIATAPITPLPPLPWTAQVGLLMPLAWVVPIAAAVALRWAAAHMPRGARRTVVVSVAALIVLLALGEAIYAVRAWSPPNSLLAAFPAALLLLLLPPRGDVGDPQWRESVSLVAIAFAYTAGVAVLAPLGDRTVPIGGSQFGPRFLLPIVPLLAASVAYAVERRDRWAADGISPQWIAAAAAIAVLASAAIQAQGVRELRMAKASYERLLRATEAVPAGQLIATDVWWYPAIAATVLDEHPTVAIDLPATGTAGELLARPEMSLVPALTLVTSAGGSAHTDAAFAAAGWHEVRRHTVPLWMSIDFIELSRDIGAHSGADRESPACRAQTAVARHRTGSRRPEIAGG